MATSGTTSFNMDFTEIAEEAWERAGREMRSGYDLRTARRSMNLMTIEWQNRGINLWTIDEGTVSLTEGTATYNLPADTIDISGVQSGDALENLNGTNIQILDIISSQAFKVNVNTNGGSIANYVANSGTVTKNGSVPSNVAVNVEGVLVANFFQDRSEIEDIRIQGSTISSTTSNQDLEITSPGTGTVRINDVLEIPAGPYTDDASLTPLLPDTGIRLYSNPQGTGKTGLYYVNSNNTNDEVISKNRSLLFSMLF